MFDIKGKFTNAKVMIDNIDENCMAQIVEMINNEAFTNPVAIMPDCHSGKGSVVGFTMPVGEKIIANVVGVDIGCGMLSFNIGKINIDHVEFDRKVREKIPFGINVNDKSKVRLMDSVKEVCDRIGMDFDYAVKSIGSLGGGNHFIEIGKSANTGDIWITIHTGSRNFGKKICEYWQNIASMKDVPDVKEELKKIKASYPKNEWDRRIKDFKIQVNNVKKSPLDYLEGKNKAGYLKDMKVAQEYSKLNRQVIMLDILNILDVLYVDCIETIHNYIDFNDAIMRKGAIRSYVGERMIIPFNMRDGILICEGKSNPEWNYSAPHGAGRVYSRSRAKAELNMDKFEKDMEGIFSTSVCQGTIDECPDAYKDAKVIEACIEPTATILDRIIPIHNMKSVDTVCWKKKMM